MSKTSKAKQLMTICLSVPLATAAAVFAAPTASANYAVVKVFDTPEVQYINVRNTADTSTNENIIDTISAGSFVWPMCWISGSAVPSPFPGQPASTIWYRIPGYPTGLVSHAYLDTGGDDPVVPMCDPNGPPEADRKFPFKFGGNVTVYLKKPPTIPERYNIAYFFPNNPHVEPGLPEMLLAHYQRVAGTPGADTFISWNYFVDYQDFLDIAYKIPVGGMTGFDPNRNKVDLPTHLALGHFDIYRLSSSCYLVYDYYNFEAGGEYDILHQEAVTGAAMEYNIFSIGDLPNAPAQGGSDGLGTAGGQAKTCSELGLDNGGGGW